MRYGASCSAVYVSVGTGLHSSLLKTRILARMTTTVAAQNSLPTSLGVAGGGSTFWHELGLPALYIVSSGENNWEPKWH